ncbi:TonB-dependent receptor [Flavobacterium dankookense]|uniref:Outer membrane receptor protein involved in Fe transport n=1 Tax=Flavobacterium dankookense TaxID=706186 RepID=A0A4R6QA43_9FLAO|nr:TonB-dependent receptor [Flavobacterium dankookense]TDP58756.1 outer membrane receptor protein involved in Fe transport [Flavobacterium dankookense]
MRLKLIVITLLFTLVGLAQTKGTIKGVITDKDLNNEPLPFANVVVKGQNIAVNTDENGGYSIAIVPGEYILEFSFLGYENATEKVIVKENETIIVNKSIGSGSYTLQDVVIQNNTSREKETALLLEQKNAVEIKQSIGAQEMSRKGVSTVEQGVSKISGVSKVEDRGIFIRGLDDRYNYMQINGLNFIPSDPNLKTIPLSFIPTDIVRNIDVFKTFNTGLYQDFAGASINIWTKDISSKPFTKVSLSTGFNSLASFKDFKTSDEGSGNFFGYTGEKRNLPNVYGENVALGYQASPSESKDLFNASWTPDRTTAPLSFGTSITNSDSFDLENDRKIGYIFNINFNNNYQNQSGVRRNINSEGTAFKDFDLNRWNYTTQKSALASINLKKSNKYNFLFNLIYIQNSENEIREFAGENTDFITIDKPFFLRDTKYLENSSIGFQQIGTIYFKDKKHTLEYGIAATLGKNNMPDRKILITEGVEDDANFVTFNGVNPFRFYSILDNVNANGKVEYEIKFGEETDGKYKNVVRFGYAGDMTTFNFFNRTIRLNANPSLTETALNTNFPQVFFDTNFDAGHLFYASTPDPTYKVDINQFTNAGFINFAKNWSKLTLDFGVRIEYMFRETKYREETSSVNSPFKTKTYDPIDFSPVLNAKYLVNDKTNLRFTASKTSTKPRVREILPFRYQDGDGNFTLGNPDIKNTQNYNADFKIEYFPKNNATFSATVFGKYIQDPISRLVEGTSTGFLENYANFDEATLYGLELETTFSFDLLFPDNIIAEKTTLGLNTILMKSNEKADASKFPQLTSTSRSLQGASDFIINADLSYDVVKTEKTESRATLIFNTFSDRIYGVGNSGAADFIEQPIDRLDFTWRNTFNKNYQVNLTLRNLLDSEIIVTQDATRALAFPDQYSNISRQLNQGISVGLEFSYTF